MVAVAIEVGEELVGAYLTECLECDHVLYNVRAPGGGSAGQNEIDVIGLDFEAKRVYLCEVATNIRGYAPKGRAKGVAQVRRKLQWQRRYAREHLKGFPHRIFMFWSPHISSRTTRDRLSHIKRLKLVIESDYTRRVGQLRDKAKGTAKTTGNSAFRMLQILEHLRQVKSTPKGRDHSGMKDPRGRG